MNLQISTQNTALCVTSAARHRLISFIHTTASLGNRPLDANGANGSNGGMGSRPFLDEAIASRPSAPLLPPTREDVSFVLSGSASNTKRAIHPVRLQRYRLTNSRGKQSARHPPRNMNPASITMLAVAVPVNSRNHPTA